MAFEIKGRLIHVGTIAEFGEKKTKKREFVIKTVDDKYPQEIKFEMIGDRVNLIDKYEIGNDIDVSFNIKGRQWNDKWFTSIEAWKISGSEKNDDGIPW